MAINIPHSSEPIADKVVQPVWYRFFSEMRRFVASPRSDEVAGFLGQLLTTRGQILRVGANGPEAFAAETADRLLGGDGTDIGLRTPAQVLATLGIEVGTYTPTLTNTTNLDGSTAYVASYVRVGDIVIVFGQFDADPTAAAPTATEMGMSLPIASNFSAASQLAGIFGAAQGAQMRIFADATNDRAGIRWNATSTANTACFFIFGYRII